MGLTNIQQALIKAIAEKDFTKATQYAKACCKEDTTQKNHWFCDRYYKILNTNGSMIEVPADLKGLIIAEDVTETFQEDRYYLSEREAEIYRNIDRMDKVSKHLMEKGIPYLNSTLLYGESGTGKTTLARYVAYKKKLPYVYINFSQVIESHLGQTGKNINRAFNYAKTTPCVFMIDEIDTITASRRGEDGGTGGEMSRVAVTIMQELDVVPNDVILIAATNRLDCIDKAIINRFSVFHKVERLSKEERRKLVQKYVTATGYSFSEGEIEALIADDTISQRKIIKNVVKEIAKKVEKEIIEQSETDGSEPVEEECDGQLSFDTGSEQAFQFESAGTDKSAS